MAKFSVYVPDRYVLAAKQLHPEQSLSQLAQRGFVEALAHGPDASPAAQLRAEIAVERSRRFPNPTWLRAAEHALHTRQAARFLTVAPPAGGEVRHGS